MNTGKTTRWFTAFSRLNRRSDFVGFHPTDEFRAAIERERSRSDRNSHGFSLTVFEVNRVDDPSATAVRLARVLRSRTRFTDAVGWVEDGNIGVLLPDTAADGARQFSDYVRCALSSGGEVPDCRVYSYPMHNEADPPREDGRQLVFDAIMGATAPATATVSQAEFPLAAEGANPLAPRAAGAGRTGAVAAEAVAACKPIEELLAAKMPWWKRALDIAGSLLALFVLSPLMLAAAALIKLVSPGPVFFRQERIGYMGRRFMCLKFRTMHVGSDRGVHRNYFSALVRTNAPMQKLETKGTRDRRLIPFGQLLRSSAIDELPQLINVLRGEMSLIGPRPCIPYEYDEFARWQRQRVHSVPGLTGLWQVSGKNRTTFAQMMRLDISYGRRRSLATDLGIVLRTVPVLVSQMRESLGSDVQET